MKITNWRRKLLAACAAGGFIAPCAAQAADLNTNLITNPGFESVDVGTAGVYGAFKILNWSDGPSTPFAYTYALTYDLGGPLAGGGKYYFTPNQSNGAGTDVTAPATILQIIDVSTGPTATAIATGGAKFDLSAYFTSYDNVPGDIGNIELRFVNAMNTGISAVILSDPAPLAGWKQASTSGLVPVGTAKLHVSLYGTPVFSGPDGYMDNLDLRIVPEPATVIFVGMGLAAAAGLGLRRRRDDS
jgi:PEP-CTERM motif